MVEYGGVGAIDMTRSGHVVVYGNNDSGKSTRVHDVLSQIENQRIAIVDLHDEYTKLDHLPNVERFVPNYKERNDPDLLKEFLTWALKKIKNNKFDIIVIDEFNQYVQNSKFETPYILQDLKNNIAHKPWNHATGIYIMRTPAQGDSEFRETAQYIISQRVTGKNAKSSFNEIQDGLGDVISSLNRFETVVVNPARYFWISEPADEEMATAKR